MEGLNPTQLIHYFDTEQRRIACGAGGDNRSTKHARSVTCQKCMGILRAKIGAVHHAESSSAHA